MKLACMLAALLLFGIASASADEAKVPRVFAAFVSPVEEPWNGVIHKTLLDARDAKEIQYTFKDRLTKAEDPETVLREQAKSPTSSSPAATTTRLSARSSQDRAGLLVLTGGVFQNVLLTRESTARLEEEGFRVHRHRQVPPGDMAA